jgi:hypothetical protein
MIYRVACPCQVVTYQLLDTHCLEAAAPTHLRAVCGEGSTSDIGAPLVIYWYIDCVLKKCATFGPNGSCRYL